jgi:hypothetical protein
MPGKFTDSLIGENLKVATEYFKAMVAASENDFNNKIKDSGGSIGFIPFKIGFTMDGLSGIKIYNGLTIDTSFLPIGYSNTLKFIVTGVDHKLNQGDWETSLNLTLIPRTDTVSKITGSLKFEAQKEAAVAPVKPAEETPVIGNLSGLNAHPSVSNTPLLKKAVLDQSTYAFNTLITRFRSGPGEVAGACAGYSFNIALKLKSHIDSKSNTAVPFTYVGSGNADSNAHRTAIKNLGIYDEYYLGTFTSSDLKSATGPIKSATWNYGDMLNYYAPGYSGVHNMHTQIYTGDIWQKGINGRNVANAAGNSGWSTSSKTNYGAFYVYGSTSMIFKLYAYKVKSQYLI